MEALAWLAGGRGTGPLWRLDADEAVWDDLVECDRDDDCRAE
jgi:hypothetical protein